MNDKEYRKLPHGWIEVSIGDIITLEYGRSLTGLERERGIYKVWGSNGVVGTHNDFLIDGPVIIVGRKGSVGTVHYSSDKCWPIDTTYYVNSIINLSSRFVYYLLIYANLSSLDKSTTIPGLNRESAYSKRILLPPLEEQNRIVEKIEELFSEIENAEITLIDIKNRLSIYWLGILRAFYEKEDVKNYVKLGEISNITMGQSPHGSTYNNKGIGIPLINGPAEFGETSFSKTVLSKWTTKPTKICNEGDIIICVRGSTTGRLNIAGFDACIGRGVAAIKSKETAIDEYLYMGQFNPFLMGQFPSSSLDQFYRVFQNRDIQNVPGVVPKIVPERKVQKTGTNEDETNYPLVPEEVGIIADRSDSYTNEEKKEIAAGQPAAVVERIPVLPEGFVDNAFVGFTDEEISDMIKNQTRSFLLNLYEDGEIYSAAAVKQLLADKDARISELEKKVWRLKEGYESPPKRPKSPRKIVSIEQKKPRTR